MTANLTVQFMRRHQQIQETKEARKGWVLKVFATRIGDTLLASHPSRKASHFKRTPKGEAMKVILGCSALLLLLFLSVSAQAGTALSLYDDFSAALINPDKWFGVEYESAPSMRENVRRIENKQLHILIRGYGDNTTSTWGSSANSRLQFTDGSAITAIKATIKIDSYDLAGLTTSDNNTISARIGGYFFNVAKPTSGSAVNDVWAAVRIIRKSGYSDPASTFHVEAYMTLCYDNVCGTGTTLGKQSLGTTKLGQKTTVRLEWDKTHHRFLAQLGSKAQVAMPYSVPETSPPGQSNNKRLDVQYSLYNSTVLPRPMAYMSAFFTNVYINKSALSATINAVEDERGLLENVAFDDAAGGS